MDAVFGNANFRNEIVWYYKTGGMSKRWFGRKHDVILFYSKTKKYVFNPQKIKSYLSHKYGFSNIEIHQDKHGFYTMVGTRDVWDIPALRGNQPETTKYPTQKPLALLERIIKTSSNEGDIVFDPFCGCATACVAAERLNRQWIGIDLSSMAIRLVNNRIKDNIGLHAYAITERNDIPKRTDQGEIPHYKTNKHELYGLQEGICLCGEHFPFRNFTIDHKIPVSKWGTDHIDNLQLLCGACNSLKGNREQAYLIARLKEKGIKVVLPPIRTT